MTAISSFDQWRKDAFFSAAEEIQESTDAMESVFRMWIRERDDGFNSGFSDELLRELWTRLGTAKWQLEEFERAVGSSHENYPSEENTITRHREFVAALRHQICCVEKTMNDLLLGEGKQPLRWVQLDEDERDEFETFLSSAPSPKMFPEIKDKFVNRESVRGFKETITINKDAKYVVEVAAKDASSKHEEAIVQEENFNGQRRSSNSSDIGAWKIVIADEEDAHQKLEEPRPETRNRSSRIFGFLRSIESTTRLKLFRNSFRKAKKGEHIHSSQGFLSYVGLKGNNPFTQGRNGLSDRGKEDSKGTNMQQTIARFGGLQRNIHVLQSNGQYGRFLRVTLLLLVTIFLVVPFVIYSS